MCLGPRLCASLMHAVEEMWGTESIEVAWLSKSMRNCCVHPSSGFQHPSESFLAWCRFESRNNGLNFEY
ncbi:hypothetical protein R6Q59_016045 [Mikania micrantha]